MSCFYNSLHINIHQVEFCVSSFFIKWVTLDKQTHCTKVSKKNFSLDENYKFINTYCHFHLPLSLISSTSSMNIFYCHFAPSSCCYEIKMQTTTSTLYSTTIFFLFKLNCISLQFYLLLFIIHLFSDIFSPFVFLYMKNAYLLVINKKLKLF